MNVSLKDIGIKGKVKVLDIWGKKELGVVEKVFGRELPMHGAGLYRLSPVK